MRKDHNNKYLVILLLFVSVFLFSGCDTIRIQDPLPVSSIQASTPPIDLFFVMLDGNITSLAQNVSFDDRTINITNRSGSGIDVGTYLGISGRNRFYFGEVLSVSGDLVTLDTPIDFEFVQGEAVVPTTRDLNVDGSITPKSFFIGVGGTGSNLTVRISRIMISMLTDTPVSLDSFGDLPSLTNGFVLRQVNGESYNIWNVKNNGEIANLCFDYDPQLSTNPAQGQDGAKFRCTFGGPEKHDTVIELKPGDSLEGIIQDDLSGLQLLRMIGEGTGKIETS